MKKKVSLMLLVIMILQILLPMSTIILESKFTLISNAIENIENIVENQDFQIDINEYIEEEQGENKYLNSIDPETKIGRFLQNIKTNGQIQIYNGDLDITNTDNILATGMLLKIVLNNMELTYNLIISGDVNGDGKITATDLSKIKNHILEQTSLIDLALKAADLNKDGKITASELTKIKRYILGMDVELNEKDYSTFSWDQTSDARKNVTTKNVLNLKVNALDKAGNTINNIKWEISGGTLDSEQGTEVNWTLPDEKNTYKIKASLEDGRYLEKEIKYVNAIQNENVESIEVEYNLDDDEDLDGLTNKEEYELGTNIIYDDTDADGINDYEEINTYGTDPLKEDTDGDGIFDLNEILLESNPCNNDSDGDGTLDNEENITYDSSNEELGVNVQISGKGNISDVIIDTVEINELDGVDAIASPIYNFSTNGSLETANVEIKYDETIIADKGFNEEDLSLYYFNPSSYTFEEVQTIIDTENNMATATLSHFSMYLLANKNTMIESLNNQIMFVVDNSGSMYSREQAKIKDSSITDSQLEEWPENDPGYKRLEIVSNLIDKLDDNFEFGVAKFTKDYTVLTDMIQSKEQAKAGLERIRTEGEKFNGTEIGSSLLTTVENFEKESTFNRYIVLITDGEDTNSWSAGYRTERAIEIAQEKNIKIITIGLGNEVDEAYLRNIAELTGGKYYYSSDANVLNDLYNSLHSELNLKRVEIENSEESKEEYLVIADSGFNPVVNGLPFENYSTSLGKNGQCYGIATLSRLLYINELEMLGNKERKIEGDLQQFDYDLSNLDLFKNNEVLANYEFENKNLEKLLTVTNEDLYDYDRFYEDVDAGKENLELKIFDECMEMIESTEGIIKIRHETVEKDYGSVKVGYLYIDMNEITEEKISKFPDLQLFKAIEYHFVSQYNEEGTMPDYDRLIELKDEETINKMIEEMNAGNPFVICYLTDGTSFIRNLQLVFGAVNHAVNGIQVLRSIENPNNYKIAIYNNNSPGEIEYLTIIKKKSILNGEISYKAYIDLEEKTNIYMGI